eukprot:TRINITY_DN3535_c0_g1_i1.p1 TRINITY_DN3535_c0_g1~~TRINITY_DN3535_c0_g1_i1.p1  ORF type:complete len:2344 (+),score=558.23 TRINITY_DN3535_c0_g1_i1:91-7032(+)
MEQSARLTIQVLQEHWAEETAQQQGWLGGTGKQPPPTDFPQVRLEAWRACAEAAAAAQRAFSGDAGDSAVWGSQMRELCMSQLAALGALARIHVGAGGSAPTSFHLAEVPDVARLAFRTGLDAGRMCRKRSRDRDDEESTLCLAALGVYDEVCARDRAAHEGTTPASTRAVAAAFELCCAIADDGRALLRCPLVAAAAVRLVSRHWRERFCVLPPDTVARGFGILTICGQPEGGHLPEAEDARRRDYIEVLCMCCTRSEATVEDPVWTALARVQGMLNDSVAPASTGSVVSYASPSTLPQSLPDPDTAGGVEVAKGDLAFPAESVARWSRYVVLTMLKDEKEPFRCLIALRQVLHKGIAALAAAGPAARTAPLNASEAAVRGAVAVLRAHCLPDDKESPSVRREALVLALASLRNLLFPQRQQLGLDGVAFLAQLLKHPVHQHLDDQWRDILHLLKGAVELSAAAAADVRPGAPPPGEAEGLAAQRLADSVERLLKKLVRDNQGHKGYIEAEADRLRVLQLADACLVVHNAPDRAKVDDEHTGNVARAMLLHAAEGGDPDAVSRVLRRYFGLGLREGVRAACFKAFQVLVTPRLGSVRRRVLLRLRRGLVRLVQHCAAVRRSGGKPAVLLHTADFPAPEILQLRCARPAGASLGAALAAHGAELGEGAQAACLAAVAPQSAAVQSRLRPGMLLAEVNCVPCNSLQDGEEIFKAVQESCSIGFRKPDVADQLVECLEQWLLEAAEGRVAEGDARDPYWRELVGLSAALVMQPESARGESYLAARHARRLLTAMVTSCRRRVNQAALFCTELWGALTEVVRSHESLWARDQAVAHFLTLRCSPSGVVSAHLQPGERDVFIHPHPWQASIRARNVCEVELPLAAIAGVVGERLGGRRGGGRVDAAGAVAGSAAAAGTTLQGPPQPAVAYQSAAGVDRYQSSISMVENIPRATSGVTNQIQEPGEMVDRLLTLVCHWAYSGFLVCDGAQGAELGASVLALTEALRGAASDRMLPLDTPHQLRNALLAARGLLPLCRTLPAPEDAQGNVLAALSGLLRRCSETAAAALPAEAQQGGGDWVGFATALFAAAHAAVVDSCTTEQLKCSSRVGDAALLLLQRVAECADALSRPHCNLPQLYAARRTADDTPAATVAVQAVAVPAVDPPQVVLTLPTRSPKKRQQQQQQQQQQGAQAQPPQQPQRLQVPTGSGSACPSPRLATPGREEEQVLHTQAAAQTPQSVDLTPKAGGGQAGARPAPIALPSVASASQPQASGQSSPDTRCRDDSALAGAPAAAAVHAEAPAPPSRRMSTCHSVASTSQGEAQSSVPPGLPSPSSRSQQGPRHSPRQSPSVSPAIAPDNCSPTAPPLRRVDSGQVSVGRLPSAGTLPATATQAADRRGLRGCIAALLGLLCCAASRVQLLRSAARESQESAGGAAERSRDRVVVSRSIARAVCHFVHSLLDPWSCDHRAHLLGHWAAMEVFVRSAREDRAALLCGGDNSPGLMGRLHQVLPLLREGEGAEAPSPQAAESSVGPAPATPKRRAALDHAWSARGPGMDPYELARASADLVWRTAVFGACDPYPRWDPSLGELFAGCGPERLSAWAGRARHGPFVATVLLGRNHHALVACRTLTGCCCWVARVLHDALPGCAPVPTPAYYAPPQSPCGGAATPSGHRTESPRSPTAAARPKSGPGTVMQVPHVSGPAIEGALAAIKEEHLARYGSGSTLSALPRIDSASEADTLARPLPNIGSSSSALDSVSLRQPDSLVPLPEPGRSAVSPDLQEALEGGQIMASPDSVPGGAASIHSVSPPNNAGALRAPSPCASAGPREASPAAPEGAVAVAAAAAAEAAVQSAGQQRRTGASSSALSGQVSPQQGGAASRSPASSAFVSPAAAGAPGGPSISPAPSTVPSGPPAPPTALSPHFFFGLFRAVPPPRRLRWDDEFSRLLAHIDRTPPKETFRVGLIRMSPSQCKRRAAPGATADSLSRLELEVLAGCASSERYLRFINSLGQFRDLRRAQGADGLPPGALPPLCNYVGGLDPRGRDGEVCLVWESALGKAAYHVATLMPGVADPAAAETDELRACANRAKAAIGNDNIVIAYAEDPGEMQPLWLQNELNWLTILVQPLAPPLNKVTVHLRPVRLGHWAVERNKDVFVGQDAERMPAGDIVAAKARCAARGYGGFAVCGDTVYFRAAERERLLAALPSAAARDGVSFYVAPEKDREWEEMAAEIRDAGLGPLLPDVANVVHDDRLGETICAATLHAALLTKSYRAASVSHGFQSNWGDRLARLARVPQRCAARPEQLAADDHVASLWHVG